MPSTGSHKGRSHLRRLLCGWLAVGAALLSVSCGGSPGGGAASSCAATETGIAFLGVAGYEDRLYNTNGFVGRREAPIRFAEVEMRVNGGVWATTHTDANGVYCLISPFSLPPNSKATVRVKALAKPPESPSGGGTVKVVDALGLGVYHIDSTPRSAQPGSVTVVPTLLSLQADLTIAAGRVLLRNQGGAFNILDVAIGGFQFVQGVWRQPLPDLLVTWRSDLGGGTFFNRTSNRINMKGNATSDSDEYDDDIVLHEFGHFALRSLSDDSSQGGPHFINGATQDARLAWSEGWANFFSTMVRHVNPGGFSNLSRQPATIIDSFGLSEGSQSAVRFSYELTTPQAFLPDARDPVNQANPVSDQVFRQLTKYATSEVSVAVILWDMYLGDDSGQNRWQGVGAPGILKLIQELPNQRAPVNPLPVTLTTLLDTQTAVFPQQAAAMTAHFLGDRQLSTLDDRFGPDDSKAETDLLTLAVDKHFINDLAPGISRAVQGHTLYPLGDVDMFHFFVRQAGNYAIETENLHDGADTFLEIFAADGLTPILLPDGTVAANDNHIAYSITVREGTNNGGEKVKTFSWLDHSQCGWQSLALGGGTVGRRFTCPPNAANPPPPGRPDLAIREYLSSKVQLNLSPGDYYAKVSRSSTPPPSAGHHGGYDLRITGGPPVP